MYSAWAHLLLLCLLVPPLDALPNPGNIIGIISDPRINNSVIHGIAASRRHKDVIYTLINSGGRSIVHAVGANTGKLLGTLNVTGPAVKNCSWNQIAVGPSRKHDHDTFIYIADFGENMTDTCNIIYRVQEPEMLSVNVDVMVHGTLKFTNEAGNAKTLMVDEKGVVWLVSKANGDPRLFSVPTTAWLQTDVELGSGLELPVIFKDNFPTDGDISFDGRYILLKSQNKTYGYSRRLTETIDRTLLNKTSVTLEGAEADQQVVVCWDLNVQGYYMLNQQYIWYFTNSLRFNTGGEPGGERNGVILGTISDPRINEASGVAASRRHPGVLYTVNDSGDPPYVYAIEASTGKFLMRLNLTGYGVENCDWEDIAVGPASQDSDMTYIYVGDIGGNFHKCDVIYRVKEPYMLTSGDMDVPVDAVVRYSYTAANSETLMVDEKGVVWIVSKVDETFHPHLFRVPVDAWSKNETVDLGSGIKLPVAFEHEYPTAGDISSDGRCTVKKMSSK